MPDLAAQKKPDSHFEWLRSETIESLDVIVSEYRHQATGAMHYHIAADNDENVFLVALRTVPTDSTGVAHILEHTALCGSERYPVRDPFFMMIRRSLNTFMNAFTSSDWTAYPFASKNRKDFDNLSNIYLDAVFFSRLDPLDFAQEGHRVEFATPDDPTTPLEYKGVVFNEMKGAMSAPVSKLYQCLSSHLFPTNTYHHNSGGEPRHIPDLSYDELKAFYQTHYHPSNSVFITYGDIPAAEHQAKFQERALHRFTALDKHIAVSPEQRFNEPCHVTEYYPHTFQDGESKNNKTHITFAWLLGESTDLESQLKAHLLSDVLLDNSASPLRHLLETCGLGTGPSPLCGLEDSNLEMAFMCGIEGASPDAASALEEKIFALLNQLAKDGIPHEQTAAALHQLELNQREVGGDGYPYGLQLVMNVISPSIHRGDPIAVLNLDPVLDKLRTEIQDPNFIKRLIKEQLLNNAHRVCLTFIPDDTLEAKEQAEERARLDAIQAALTAEQQQAIITQAQALEARQNQIDDISILPKVGIEDVPSPTKMPKASITPIHQQPLHRYSQGTNGLVYHQVVTPLPALADELLPLLPLYTRLLSDLGAGKHGYMDIQNHINAATGGIGCFTSIKAATDDEQNTRGYLVYSGKALDHNQERLAELLHLLITQTRFDEHERIREVIAQKRSRMESSITGNGHTLAMLAASSQLSPCSQLSHRLSGLSGINYMQDLDKQLNDKNAVIKIAKQLEELHQQLNSHEKQFVVIGESDALESVANPLSQHWSQQPPSATGSDHFDMGQWRRHVHQAWLTNTQVNFCAKSYATVPSDHPDAAPLSVLSGVLRNGFLHKKIREQGGAYGGGASHDASNATFRFYSYRDPRLTETLADFDASIDWLLSKDHGYEPVEEAILGIVSSIDKPGSPAGEAKQAFQNTLFDRDDNFQQRYRQRVLDTTEQDLKRVATTYLQGKESSTAIISSKKQWQETPLSGSDAFALFDV